MEYSFTRYLKAKKTVDDRAMNRFVWQQLENHFINRIGTKIVKILDLGSGTGSMLQRLIIWEPFSNIQYLGVDSNFDNHQAAISEIKGWGVSSGFNVESMGDQVRLSNGRQKIQAEFHLADIYEFLENHPTIQWDLIVANAFLDLVNLSTILTKLHHRISPKGLAYFTINYDGLTFFTPEINPALDSLIYRLYDQSMDDRLERGLSSGGSHTGHKMFAALSQTGWELIAAGGSDWVVHPTGGFYTADEQYFLFHILHFIEGSLTDHPELNPVHFTDWIRIRREQIMNGQLTLVAHNLDFLVSRR